MITLKTFGEKDGQSLVQAVLKNDVAEVGILSLGCITQFWRLAGQSETSSLVLGYKDPSQYLNNPASLGAIVGRVANRIKDSVFTMDGAEYAVVANEGANCLHGGPEGMGSRNFAVQKDGENAIVLTHTSPDGHMGFPGNVEFTIRVELDGYALTYDMRATTDKRTPINLAQHSYYNLNGAGAVWDHHLQSIADAYTPVGKDLIPLGTYAPTTDRDLDLVNGGTIKQFDPAQTGLDINLKLPEGYDQSKPVATVTTDELQLKLWTDQKFVQLYNSCWMQPEDGGFAGQEFNAFEGLCLEPQKTVNAPNSAGHEDVFIAPSTPYSQKLVVEISPK